MVAVGMCPAADVAACERKSARAYVLHIESLCIHRHPEQPVPAS